VANSRIAKFLRVSWPERTLLVRALLTLAVARLILWLLPFKTVRKLLTPRRLGARSSVITTERVQWAVNNAQRVIPDATCLPQAVTAEALLTRAGHPVLLRIGVMKTTAGKFLAHAWAESEGRIVVGNLPKGLGEFSHLPPLPGAWSEDAK
jgi:hypothetical protein